MYLRLRKRHIALPSLVLEERANNPLMNGMNYQYDDSIFPTRFQLYPSILPTDIHMPLFT